MKVVVLEGDCGAGAADVDPVFMAFEDGKPESFDLRSLQVGLPGAHQDQFIINLFRVAHVDRLVSEVLGELILISLWVRRLLFLLLVIIVVVVNYLEPEGTVVFSYGGCRGLARVFTLPLFFVSFLLRHSDQLISDEDRCLSENCLDDVFGRYLLQLLNALHLVLERG